jgi:hypothetical protein
MMRITLEHRPAYAPTPRDRPSPPHSEAAAYGPDKGEVRLSLDESLALF